MFEGSNNKFCSISKLICQHILVQPMQLNVLDEKPIGFYKANVKQSGYQLSCNHTHVKKLLNTSSFDLMFFVLQSHFV